MTKSLQKQLAARSEELQLAWCELLPEQMGCFMANQWILLIDERTPGRKAVMVVPPHMLKHLPFMLETLRRVADKSENESN